MKTTIRFSSFYGVLALLGADRHVTLEEDGGTSETKPTTHSLTIHDLSVEEADAILGQLSGQKAEAAKPAPAAAGKSGTPAPAPDAAKTAPAPAGPAPAAGKPAGRAAAPKPAPAPAPALDMPGDDEEEEEEEEEPAAAEETAAPEEAEEEEDESGLLPVPENLLSPKAKMRDVVAYLNDRGYRTREQLLQGCEALRPHVPILKSVPDMAERLERALQVMNYSQ
jgi:hypothetical protein